MSETVANPSRFYSRHMPTLALFGVAVVYAAFNVISSWIWPDKDDDVTCTLCFGVFVLEPMIVGAWVALGSGSWWTRVPIAIPIFMLMVIAPAINPATFADIERREFNVTVLAGFTIFAASMLLLFTCRWLTGARLIAKDRQQPTGKAIAQFSIKYLLILTMLYAAVLGTVSQIKFHPHRSSYFPLGPDFVISMLICGSGTLAIAVLPTLSVPLLILHGRPSKRVVLAAITFGAVVTVLIAVFWIVNEGESFETMEAVLVAQVGAVLAGTLTALSLRLAGVKLVRVRAGRPPLITAVVVTPQ